MGISSALGSQALIPSGFGFRNSIINGDFRVAQRGTSAVTLSGGGVWPVDRFFAQSDGTITVTAQQATDAPSGTGLRNSVLFTTTSANINNNYRVRFTTRLEGYTLEELGLTNNVSLYLSFWVKSDVAGSYTVNVSSGYRGGSTYNFAYIPLSYTVNSANTWEYKTIRIPPYLSGGAGWQYGNNTGIELTFLLGVGSSYTGVRSDTIDSWSTFSTDGYFSGQSSVNNTTWGKTNGHKFFITGVQLEANNIPTPFERRPYGVELQLCQRYYQRNNLGTGVGFSGFVDSTSVSTHFGSFPVEMRTSPDCSSSGAFEIRRGGVTSTTVSSVSFIRNNKMFRVTATASTANLTIGQSVLFSYSSGDPYLDFSAEL